MFTDRISVVQRDIVELMLKMNTQDGRLREISTSTRSRNQEARSMVDQVETLKNFINGRLN